MSPASFSPCLGLTRMMKRWRGEWVEKEQASAGSLRLPFVDRRRASSEGVPAQEESRGARLTGEEIEGEGGAAGRG